MSDDNLWESSGSVFRPSYSSTWLNCSGSLIPSMTAFDTAGTDAAVGTVFHELMAFWGDNGRPDDWLGQRRDIVQQYTGEVFEITIDEDMFSFGAECFARYEHIQGDRFYETRVDISSLTPIPDQGGTADLAICSLGVLDVIDYKYGIGVQVWALNNTQLLCYAWGFFCEYDWVYNFLVIRLHIAQPRLNHFDVWEITREQLLEFADWAKERALLAWMPNANRSPSPTACMWCKVRMACPAMEAARQALADLSFEVLDVSHEQQQAIVIREPILPAPVTLTTDQLAKIQVWRKLMEKWFSDGADELITRGLQGDDLGGLWKVAEGRSRRRWKDEEEAADGLARVGVAEDEMYERKLVSPNRSEKLLRAAGIRGPLLKSYLAILIDRPPGKPTLVPIGDNRAEVGSIVDDTFEGEV